jgi:hypothetical protein
LGVYDADYTIKNLFQVSDDTKHTLEDQTQRGANCYVSDNKLIMFIDVVEDIHSNEGLENSKFDVVY